MAVLRGDYRDRLPHILISGCLGPSGDGYRAGQVPEVEDAVAYHVTQIDSFAAGGADLVTSFTLTSTNEALGVALAARTVGLPCVIGLTVETDGRLPSGTTLQHAIETIDEVTAASPEHYMINCAHPSHVLPALDDQWWTRRVRAVRANASCCSHSELDSMTELDEGDPAELAAGFGELRARLPELVVVGGCCGTDVRHVRAMAEALVLSGEA